MGTYSIPVNRQSPPAIYKTLLERGILTDFDTRPNSVDGVLLINDLHTLTISAGADFKDLRDTLEKEGMIQKF